MILNSEKRLDAQPMVGCKFKVASTVKSQENQLTASPGNETCFLSFPYLRENLDLT